MPPEESLRIFRELMFALGDIHEQGILHRDLKPQNLMFRADGSLAIVDFGIAKHIDSIDQTNKGEILGTPRYMSPEQVQGRAHPWADALDRRSWSWPPEPLRWLGAQAILQTLGLLDARVDALGDHGRDEARQALAGLALAEHQRWLEPDHVRQRSTDADQEPRVSTAPLDFLCLRGGRSFVGVPYEFDADHQPATSHLTHQRRFVFERLQLRHDLGTASGGIFGQLLVLHHFDVGERRCATDRVAAATACRYATGHTCWERLKPGTWMRSDDWNCEPLGFA